MLGEDYAQKNMFFNCSLLDSRRFGGIYGIPATMGVTRTTRRRGPNGRPAITAEKRSAMMASIKGRDTTPELVVRKCLRQLGLRYRLDVRSLPGRPDLVLGKRRKVIFVNGCFWHQHAGCKLASTPKARPEYWIPKLAGNRARDAANEAILAKLGWDVLVVWECEVGDRAVLLDRLRRFMHDESKAKPATRASKVV